jgi:hypothetical protein
MIEKCAVLVVSCDNYADVWQPFFTLFRQFWGNCPYPTYLLANTLQPHYPSVEVVNVGEDRSWSDNLILALQKIEQEYIFLFLEDLMLCGTVHTQKVDEIFRWAVENNVNYVRLNPSTKPDKPYNELVGLVSEGTIYRASVVACLWKKSVLLDILKEGENAWEFELYGSIRSDKYDGFYSTYIDYFPIINSIIKRVWETSAIRTLQRLGVRIDFSQRRKMTTAESFLWKVKLVRSKIFSMIPAQYRRKIKAFVQGGT